MITLEAWRREKVQGIEAFHITVPFFLSRCKECHLLLPLLRNGCSLKDPFVYCRFHNVLFQPISLFRTHSNKLHECQNPGILSFQNVKSFQPPIMIKKIALPTTKVDVNKPDLRRIYLRNAKTNIFVLGLISEMQRRL